MTAAAPEDDDLEALRRSIGDPRRWTVVIDFDGTLAPIVDHPDRAAPAPGAIEAIEDLARVCEVALLSGRALDDLVARLGRTPPGVLLVGGHGSEARHPDGTRTALTDLDAATAALDEVEATIRPLVDETAGWIVERKATSVAVHHRRVTPTEVDRILPEVRRALEGATSSAPGFVVLDGKAVVELRVRGTDKGVALRWILDRAAARADLLPGRPDIKPLVFGDDTTDEDAFEVALELGGQAVRIDELPSATSARFRLRDPGRVVTLLRDVRDALGPDPSVGTPRAAWDASDAGGTQAR
ncbi:trehalose-phosphatase [Nitriliruptor alkaliphilus]|uniref:trehalose-phosphatase n=1 Tax=Nitriliruptor alkaliphilus TaxID=427918 RepID=UPI000698C43F|nr:trehalose-phosphatase [Nitriliruptor alkaliphilus]